MTAIDGGSIAVVRDVAKTFTVNGQQVRALRAVTLSVARGEYVTIAGPSGSGKSTLLQLIGGLERPTSGTVAIGGQDLASLGDADLTRLRLRQIGFIFQRFHLLPVLTARENVELPMAEAGMARTARRERALELLRYVGLGERAEHLATELSGGEMQRVAIARALANRPALILADEPTGELDARTGDDILRLFDRLNADGATLIVVSHDERLASRAHRTVHLFDGSISEDRVNRPR